MILLLLRCGVLVALFFFHMPGVYVRSPTRLVSLSSRVLISRLKKKVLCQIYEIHGSVGEGIKKGRSHCIAANRKM